MICDLFVLWFKIKVIQYPFLQYTVLEDSLCKVFKKLHFCNVPSKFCKINYSMNDQIAVFYKTAEELVIQFRILNKRDISYSNSYFLNKNLLFYVINIIFPDFSWKIFQIEWQHAFWNFYLSDFKMHVNIHFQTKCDSLSWLWCNTLIRKNLLIE